MCFSATGSFALSAILAGVGTVSLAQSRSRRERMLALMPLLFAVQQLAEGTIWLTIGPARDSLLHGVAVHVFLAFALILWPAWLPLSLFRLEPPGASRRRLGALVVAGLAVAAVGMGVLIHWRPQARVAGHSIAYDYGLNTDHPATQLAYLLLYLVPTLMPFMVSTFALARTMGVVFLLALAATLVVQRAALTSVWCFFAAILSVLMVVALHRSRRAALGALPLPS